MSYLDIVLKSTEIHISLKYGSNKALLQIHPVSFDLHTLPFKLLQYSVLMKISNLSMVNVKIMNKRGIRSNTIKKWVCTYPRQNAYYLP